MSDEPPRVVLTTTCSVDGRISLGRHQRLLEPDVGARWETMTVPDAFDGRCDLDRTVVLEGSGSFVDVDAPAPDWPEPSTAADQLRRDWLPARAARWFVVADGRGRLDWRFTGDDTTRLHVLVCDTTPLGYLQRLRDLAVGYFVVGAERVDLDAGLRRIRRVLHADTVVADSGGTINAALLAAGLVDVVDVVTLPGLVGGASTPTMLDGPDRGPQALPVRLELLSVEVDRGAVRTRYAVVR